MNYLKVLAIAVLAIGCVTQSEHQRQVDDLNKQRQADATAAGAKIQELNDKLAQLQKDLDAKTADYDKTKKELDDAQALIGDLKARLEKLGQKADSLSGEKGAMAAALEDAKARLEELRKQKAAAEERAATFRGLMEKLKNAIAAGQLSVTVRKGKMIIVLSNDVLFDSGKTQLKPAGKTALTSVATALAAIKDRHFVVAGHTDNVPIHSTEFPSNWELSTARAVEVTRLLIAGGVPPTALAAAGYGEFDSISQNDTPAHKTANRRIEIELQPNLSELPAIEDLIKTPPAKK